jgi:protein gp37
VSANSSIEWTDTTWNPTTGCDQVSAGCDNCYALPMAKRLKAMGSAKYQKDGDPRTSGPGFGIAVHPETLDEPHSWRTPRKVFVNSMSDLFHAKVPVEFIQRVFEVMANTPQHTYQILTKRARRAALLAEHLPWPSNVWMGTSVENARVLHRVDALRRVPAAVRFLSCEPLLGPLDGVDLDGIGWVIAGGESGHKARPMHPEWVRGLRDRSAAAGVPFFMKQWGEWGPAPWSVRVCDPAVGWQGTKEGLAAAKRDAEARGATHAYAVWADEHGWELYEPPHKPWSLERADSIDDRVHAPMRRWGKKAAGRELDGRTWDEYPALAAGGVS